jgi:hypothetical protein
MLLAHKVIKKSVKKLFLISFWKAFMWRMISLRRSNIPEIFSTKLQYEDLM